MLVGLSVPRIGRVRRRGGGIDDEPLEQEGRQVPGIRGKYPVCK